MTFRLIVNADDFGLTEGVSNGILSAMRAGRVTSTTVMANRPDLARQAAALQKIPGISAGIHLVLSSGKPILPPEQVKTLVDDSGFMPRNYRTAAGRADIAEVELEWQAQIQVALSLGLHLSHIDSHHHVHLHPPFTEVAVRLATRFGIPAMRAASPLDLHSDKHEFTDIVTAEVAMESRRIITSAGLTHPDRLLTGVTALELLAANFSGVAELCCHPGHVDGLLPSLSSLCEAREDELLYLLSDEFAEILAARKVSLVPYSFLFELF